MASDSPTAGSPPMTTNTSPALPAPSASPPLNEIHIRCVFYANCIYSILRAMTFARSDREDDDDCFDDQALSTLRWSFQWVTEYPSELTPQKWQEAMSCLAVHVDMLSEFTEHSYIYQTLKSLRKVGRGLSLQMGLDFIESDRQGDY